jgi:hypothetical protein
VSYNKPKSRPARPPAGRPHSIPSSALTSNPNYWNTRA